jgi:HD superfamily phosphohydrolase
MNDTLLINDPVHGFIYLRTGLLRMVLHHRYVQRLRYIKQLGLTHLVYPCAGHSRFAHVLGAMHLMSKAINTLQQKNIAITEAEAEATECAMLLHDIGHGPFSHALEYRILGGISHEEISLAMMRQMNTELGGKLALAIDIFQNRYPKKFLHQLISSQLDMDRMDYLARDSFFAGVAEGAVGVERIIQMLNVADNELVIEEKGIHPVEQFLIARRQMYWQVYLHKAVVAAEQMIVNIVRRMVFLLQTGSALPISETLLFLLKNNADKTDLTDSTLNRFALLTDGTIDAAIAECALHSDSILRRLCLLLSERTLPEIEISDIPFEDSRIQNYLECASATFAISPDDAHYFVTGGTLSNSAYSLTGDNIKIRTRSGKVCDIRRASDMLDATAFLHDSKKYFLCACVANEK